MRLWQLICTFALLTIAASSCSPPPPAAVYLSLDGIGSAEETNLYYQAMDPRPEPTLAEWKKSRCFPDDKFPEVLNDSSPNGQLKAFYYNPSDLGLGREMRCAKCPDKGGKKGLISCAVSNHGPLDGPTLGIALANRLKKPDALNNQDPAQQHQDLRKAIIRESLQIVDDFLNQPAGTRTKFRRQTVAMDFDANRAANDQVRFYIYDAEDAKFFIPPNTVPGGLIPGLALDNEGVKFMRNCTYCHGGTFDPKTNLIRGSSFLDFNLAYLDYGDSPELLSAKEKKDGDFAETTQFKTNSVRLQKLNELVRTTLAASDLAPEIAKRIDSSHYTPDTSSGSTTGVTTDFVPDAWKTVDPDLFVKVVRPYCATCHFSQSATFNLRPLDDNKTPLTFGSPVDWFDRKDILQTIQNSVCGSGDMPHAEVTRLNLLADTAAFGLICPSPSVH